MLSLILLWLAACAWAFPFCSEESTVHSPSVSGFKHQSESHSSCPNGVFNRVETPIGYARGIQSSPGVIRFAVRYATSSRWQEALPVTTWSIPNDDPEALPPWCPQSGPPATQYSEDCLFLVLYVPVQAAASRKLNTLVWVHGGSFVEGSATGPGMDGTSFALASQSIVVTVQYRLGVLGFLPPPSLDQNVNLGVKDITTALEFLHRVLPSLGGDPGEITMAGQSSGAMMLRALLAAPTAALLFKSAILHSDPMFYNFLPKSAYTQLQTSYYKNISCSTPNLECLDTLPLSSILSAQFSLLNDASSMSPAAGDAEPMRPMVDGTFITMSLTGSSFPSLLKPVIITTVENEAGQAIAMTFPSPLPMADFDPIVEGSFGPNRTQILLALPYYQPQAMHADPITGNDQTRMALELLGTDANWRCSGWTFARTYAVKGGNVHVGVFQVGATYPSNANMEYCTIAGRVCHEDDIYITFGTTPSPTNAQSCLTREIQARWSAFMHDSDPNPPGLPYATWTPVETSGNVHALQFGLFGGEAADGGCAPTLWGDEILYDWQIYGVV